MWSPVIGDSADPPVEGVQTIDDPLEDSEMETTPQHGTEKMLCGILYP